MFTGVHKFTKYCKSCRTKQNAANEHSLATNRLCCSRESDLQKSYSLSSTSPRFQNQNVVYEGPFLNGLSRGFWERVRVTVRAAVTSPPNQPPRSDALLEATGSSDNVPTKHPCFRRLQRPNGKARERVRLCHCPRARCSRKAGWSSIRSSTFQSRSLDWAVKH